MHRFLTNVAAAVQHYFGRPAPRPQGRRVRLRVEALEDRQLLASSVTDMTALAALFPTTQAQTLYLNFEGFDTGYFATQPFQSTTGNAAHHDRDIHDILFRTSEIFAPFNVRVMRRLWGYGMDGATTVFIGDRLDINGARAGTPGDFVDYPGDLRGQDHVPNSDPFDLAVVDPVTDEGTIQNAATIARRIAHETGHTFGLTHVRTLGTDPDALVPFDGSGTVPEAMSYDSTNQPFRNQTFNVTNWNNTPAGVMLQPIWQPKWDGSVITTQNSYTYLQTRLGARPADDYGNVAHDWVLDASFVDGPKPSLSVGSKVNANIKSWGDHDVFRFTPTTTQTLAVSASAAPVMFTMASVGSPGGDEGGLKPPPELPPSPPAPLNPVLLVYNDTGSLIAFNNDRSATDTNSRVVHTFQAGQTYYLTVGGANSTSLGIYQLRIDALAFPIAPVQAASFMTASPGSMAAPSSAFSAAQALPDFAAAQAPQPAGVMPVAAIYPHRAAVVESIRPGATLAVDSLFAAQAGSIRPTTLPSPGSIRPGSAALDVAWRDGWQPLQPANLVLIM